MKNKETKKVNKGKIYLIVDRNDQQSMGYHVNFETI